MARFHATSQGDVPFTATEELEADAEHASRVAQGPERIKAEITVATQKRLDDFAATRGYDSILSACTYASSNIGAFAADGQRCVVLRDQTWGALYALLSDVQAERHVMPATAAEVMAILPALSWLV